MKTLCFALPLSCMIVAPGAFAADRVVSLTTPEPVRGSIAAMKLIANPQDAAERAINAALQRLDAKVVKAAEDCKGGDWTRVVDAPMRGPGFLSLVITDSYACEDAAHPDAATASIVYSLVSGKPVDWARLLPPSLIGKQELVDEGGSKFVTLESKRLFALYMDGYTDGGATGQDLLQCREALKESGDPPPANVWLDAKSGGLAVEIELPHAVAACEDVVIIPASRLSAEGAQPALLKALSAAHGA
jgi:hypothetical protein